MGAGMFFCQHKQPVAEVFRVRAAYMPEDVEDTVEPYNTTIQWSRRFIGLKLSMTLAESGRDQLAAQIEHQAAMGALLRSELAASGWLVLNEPPWPMVCFTHPRLPGEELATILNRLYGRGEVWISLTRLKGESPALRACITSFRTQQEDVVFWVGALNAVLEG